MFYHLGELDQALTYALGAGSLFDISEQTEYVSTILCMPAKPCCLMPSTSRPLYLCNVVLQHAVWISTWSRGIRKPLQGRPQQSTRDSLQLWKECLKGEFSHGTSALCKAIIDKRLLAIAMHVLIWLCCTVGAFKMDSMSRLWA